MNECYVDKFRITLKRERESYYILNKIPYKKLNKTPYELWKTIR